MTISRTKSVYLPIELIEKAEQEAIKLDRSFNYIVALSLKEHFKDDTDIEDTPTLDEQS